MSKMAAKSKKRLSKIDNKLLKLEKLELNDIICSICQSILVEPVTLPCYHDFCQRCFNGSIENNSLCCPLCRLRIGSWLRSATKQKNVVNLKLWEYIQNKFSYEINKKLNGEDIKLSEDKPILRLSAPGEIRLEYEAELKRLRSERLKLEQKHLAETELLIKKLQQEENEAQKRYLERLKQDEILAQQIQEQLPEASQNVTTENLRKCPMKPRLKARRIDSFLTKLPGPLKESPVPSDDNTSTNESTPRVISTKSSNKTSPEILPNYGRLLKNILDKKPVEGSSDNKDLVNRHDKSAVKSKTTMQSLLVSLPLPCTGILQHKNNPVENRSIETGSVDSMQQELCYFKPIDGSTPTSFSSEKTFPLRVPSVRAEQENSPEDEAPPSRDQYLEGLCQLRNLSLAQNLPSAFVIALNILKVKKDISKKTRTKRVTVSPCITPDQQSVTKRTGNNRNKNGVQIDGITKLNTQKSLRRTRSMGSISKDENESTPKKKVKERKACSEKKVYLRSNTKKPNAKSEIESPPIVTESINNNNKINLAVKNLSSPLENCDVKNLLREQLRIEKLIEQEKSDYELAQKLMKSGMDAGSCGVQPPNAKLL